MDQASPTTRRIVGRVKDANHALVVTVGWPLGLVLAAIFLPLGDLGIRPASALIKSVLAVLVVWTTYTAIAIPLSLYRAWLRIRIVPNRIEYALWVGFETFCALALGGGIAYYVLQHRR